MPLGGRARVPPEELQRHLLSGLNIAKCSFDGIDTAFCDQMLMGELLYEIDTAESEPSQIW